MKLYATTTSERATKGQGGNGLLTITLYGEKREPLGDIIFTSCQHDPVKCHKGHGLAQIRVFNNLLDVQVDDYPDKVLPPYLEKATPNPCTTNHTKTTKNGLCLNCGYNTLHLTNKELKIDCGCEKGVFTCRKHYLKSKQKLEVYKSNPNDDGDAYHYKQKPSKCYCDNTELSIPHYSDDHHQDDPQFTNPKPKGKKQKGDLCSEQGHEADEFGYCKNCNIQIITA